jgi:hypothetical protein
METKSIEKNSQETLGDKFKTAVRHQRMRNFSIVVLATALSALIFSNFSSGAVNPKPIENYSQINPYGQQSGSYSGAQSSGNCCDTGGSGQNQTTSSSSGNAGSCCSTAKSLTKDQAKSKALDYYYKKYNDRDVTTKVEDYGCHLQVNIYKNGKLVKSISFRDGKLSELN